MWPFRSVPVPKPLRCLRSPRRPGPDARTSALSGRAPRAGPGVSRDAFPSTPRRRGLIKPCSGERNSAQGPEPVPDRTGRPGQAGSSRSACSSDSVTMPLPPPRPVEEVLGPPGTGTPRVFMRTRGGRPAPNRSRLRGGALRQGRLRAVAGRPGVLGECGAGADGARRGRPGRQRRHHAVPGAGSSGRRARSCAGRPAASRGSSRISRRPAMPAARGLAGLAMRRLRVTCGPPCCRRGARTCRAAAPARLPGRGA